MKKHLTVLLATAVLFLNGAEWKYVRGSGKTDSVKTQFTGHGTWICDFQGKPGTHGIFSADVTSDNSVLFLMRGADPSNTLDQCDGPRGQKIGYNAQGKKQTVKGWGKFTQKGIIRIEMIITPVPGRENTVTKVENVSIKPTDSWNFQPEMKSSFQTETVIDENTVIVIPSNQQSLARSLAEKIRRKFDNKPVILTDKDVCESKHHFLRLEYRSRTLILLGSLDTNRAFWTAYGKTLDAADAYYPGGDGYEIRTAVNVCNTGKNQLIIGASSEKGLAAGTEEFLSMISGTKVPHLLKVQLGGECAKKVAEDIALWKKYPNSKLPGTSPGYDTIRSWYHHALMYYWTGMDFYREQAHRFLKPILEQKAYSHHYLIEWLYLTWDVTRNCGLYTADEKRVMEQYLLQNFLDYQHGPDLIWFLRLDTPYRFPLGSRHTVSPLWGQLVAADYLDRSVTLPDDVKELVKFKRQESMRAVDYIVRNYRQTDHDMEGGESILELQDSAYRYALRFEKPEIFLNRHAVDWANLQWFNNTDVRSDCLFCWRHPFQFPAAVLGSWYRDGVFRYYQNHSWPVVWGYGMFLDRYPCAIGVFHNSLKEVKPWRDSKVWIQGYETRMRERSVYLRNTLAKYPELKQKEPVVFAFLRGGWRDDYPVLALSGASDIYNIGIGEINQLSIGKSNVLDNWWTALHNRNTGLPFERNTLHVTRDHQSEKVVEERPKSGFLNWKFNMSGCQAVSLFFKDVNGVDWTRTVLMLNEKQFLINDTMDAVTDDRFDIAAIWRLNGMVLPNTTDTIYSKKGRWTFAISGSGKNFALESNTKAYLDKQNNRLRNGFAFHGALKKGEKLSVTALVQGNKDLRVYDDGSGRLLIHDRKGKVLSEITLFGNGYREITKDHIITTCDDKLVLGNEALTLSSVKDSVVWYFDTANCYRVKTPYRKVPAEENKKVKALIGKYLDSLKIPAAAATEKSAKKWAVNKDLIAVWKQNPYPKASKFFQWSQSRKFDFGRVALISGFRYDEVGKEAPTVLEYSADGKKWEKVTAKTYWIKGLTTHNYGNTFPMEKCVQEGVFGKPVNARYFRFPKFMRMQFYASDEQKTWSPAKILSVSPYILTATAVEQDYPRAYYTEDHFAAAIAPDGKLLCRKEIKGGVHTIRKLDFPEKDSIGIAFADGTIEFYDRNGKELLHFNAVQSMKDFHKKYGKNNTRHPAGGFPATYTLGAWKNGKIVIGPRYGQSSFYDTKGKMTGIHYGGLYGITNILEKGVDFDGDGEEEQIGASCAYMVHYSGTSAQKINGGGGWPEIYDVRQYGTPVWWNTSNSLGGPKHFVFKAAEFNGKKYVVDLSRVYIGIYDGKARKNTWSRTFVAPVSAGAFEQISQKCWMAAYAGDDNVITLLVWNDPEKLPAIAGKTFFSGVVNALCITPDKKLLAASDCGLFEMKNNNLILRADGTFTDVKVSGDSILTASSDGTITCWKRK